MSQRSLSTLALTTTLLTVAGCSGDTPTGANGATGSRYSVRVGKELDIRLQNIGPGNYLAPPEISSPALTYLSVELVGPYVPAGLTQQFHFRGSAPGTVIVTFHHTDRSPTVTDTVVVR